MIIWFWVSEWLLCNANSAISWREQVNFQRDDNEVSFVLDQHVELNFYSASSLKLSDKHCDSSWFGANQSLFFLPNDACLVENQQIPILLSLILPEPTTYRTWAEHANYYTADVLYIVFILTTAISN